MNLLEAVILHNSIITELITPDNPMVRYVQKKYNKSIIKMIESEIKFDKVLEHPVKIYYKYPARAQSGTTKKYNNQYIVGYEANFLFSLNYYRPNIHHYFGDTYVELDLPIGQKYCFISDHDFYTTEMLIIGLKIMILPPNISSMVLESRQVEKFYIQHEMVLSKNSKRIDSGFLEQAAQEESIDNSLVAKHINTNDGSYFLFINGFNKDIDSSLSFVGSDVYRWGVFDYDMLENGLLYEYINELFYEPFANPPINETIMFYGFNDEFKRSDTLNIKNHIIIRPTPSKFFNLTIYNFTGPEIFKIVDNAEQRLTADVILEIDVKVPIMCGYMGDVILEKCNLVIKNKVIIDTDNLSTSVYTYAKYKKFTPFTVVQCTAVNYDID